MEDQPYFTAAQVEAAKAALSKKERLSGCTSYVQRTLAIGYNTAGRIMEELERVGFITEPDRTGIRTLKAHP